LLSTMSFARAFTFAPLLRLRLADPPEVTAEAAPISEEAPSKDATRLRRLRKILLRALLIA